MASNTEEVTASLVREYLSRKGLKETLAVLDQELPRTEQSISNRSALAKAAHIELLVKRSKTHQQSHTHRTMLELLVDHVINNPIDAHPDQSPGNHPHGNASINSKGIETLDGKPITYTSTHPKPHPPGPHPIKPHPPGRVHKITATGLKGTRSAAFRTNKGDKRALIGIEEPKQSIIAEPKQLHNLQTVVANEETPSDTLLFQDIENEDMMLLDVKGPLIRDSAHKSRSTVKGVLIDIDTAKSLRELVFRSATAHSFNEEWSGQGFVFQPLPQLTYGLVQHKGGPCGVMACVQAYILQYQLYNREEENITNLTPLQQSQALVNAICSILWKVRSSTVTVALKSNGRCQQSSSRYRSDGLTEQIMLYHVNQLESLNHFITSNIKCFMDNGGVILLLYSVVLSHGIESVCSEMDDRSNDLIGSHGYCSQELVNLMLTGVASSNVFNGQTTLIENGPVLRGVASPCLLGYLTLFEHYGVCEVGSHYKNPSLPIWVVCSESHYTVLFGLSRDISNNSTPSSSPSPFTLHYYDGLAHFTEPVILEIITNGMNTSQDNDDDLIPPLELIIKTRWPDCTGINWNCEPIL